MNHNEGRSIKSSYLNLTSKRKKCGRDVDGLIVENHHVTSTFRYKRTHLLLLEDQSLLILPPLSPQVLTSTI